MIQLQRASAGSGKTYTLARKFIGYLISIPIDAENPGKGRRLCRNSSELSRSLIQILAITFTNKATAEMKERIVEKLAALADMERPEEKVDYLGDFMKEFSASREKIANICRIALETVLNNFSDFNVSTIDSFFQSVLRTFAYETNLSDSYQVEMDSDLLATMALSMSIDDIATGKNPPAQYWIDRLMIRYRERGKAWNMFAKSGNSESLYQNCLLQIKKMENEQYKLNKLEIDSYFDRLASAGISFREVYEYLERANESRVLELHSEMTAAAGLFMETAETAQRMGLVLKAGNSSPLARAKKLAALKPIVNSSKALINYTSFEQDRGKRSICFSEKVKKTVMSANPAMADDVEDKAIAMFEAWQRWSAEVNLPRISYWVLYRETLLYLGLLQEVKKNIRDYLNDNGMVELSDTGIILRDIIGDSEVPFIYERLGTRLSHYLIDEFQDTSTLQWLNISPLLRESNGRGEESLVIGDAKQSIYRFRNANSEIITTDLPSEFGADCHPCGDTVDENTNWRSDRIIVEFNNYLFQLLSSNIKVEGVDIRGIEEVYSGIVQRPSRKANEGYVAIKAVRKTEPEGGTEDKDNETEAVTASYYSEFGPLVKDFLRRGYRQKDIAFLVNTNKEGSDVIDSFVAYNATLKEGEPRIEFVSEESLKVSSSKAVATIVAALRALSRPHTVKAEDAKEQHRKGFGSWDRIGGHFALFVMRNGGKATPELLEEFKRLIMAGENPAKELQDSLEDMKAMTLPSLTEHLLHEFISEDDRKLESPYIAAFQDIILDYCERNQADVASFLRWWDTTGSNSTISSPEDIDAVKVMTIHKSKGLQFKCVVIPTMNFSFAPAPAKSEWLWVKPCEIVAEERDGGERGDNGKSIELPPVVPVETTTLSQVLKDKSADTDAFHAPEYRRFMKAYVLDIINKAYVGCTRAEEELHLYLIFSPSSEENVRNTLEKGARKLENPDIAEPEITIGSNGKPLKGFSLPAGNMAEAMMSLVFGEQQHMDNMAIEATRRQYMLQPDVEKHIEVWRGEGAGHSAFEIGRIEYGRQKSSAMLEARRAAKMKKEAGEPHSEEFVISDGYSSRGFPTALRYREPDTGMITGEDELEQQIDPRSEGKLLHALLERISTADDIERAVRWMCVKGKLTREGGIEMEALLRKYLSDPEVARWFRAGLRVMPEQTILVKDDTGNVEQYRPDRVVVDEEGTATIIDYKFGKPHRIHHRQVETYRQLLTGLADSGGAPLFKRVEGYLWYLPLEKIERVGEQKRACGPC